MRLLFLLIALWAAVEVNCRRREIHMRRSYQGDVSQEHVAQEHEAQEYEAQEHEAQEHEAQEHEAQEHEAQEHEAQEYHLERRSKRANYTYKHSDPSLNEPIQVVMLRKYIERDFFHPTAFKKCREGPIKSSNPIRVLFEEFNKQCRASLTDPIADQALNELVDVVLHKFLSILIDPGLLPKRMNGILNYFFNSRHIGFSLVNAVYEKANPKNSEDMFDLFEFLDDYRDAFTAGTLDLIASTVIQGAVPISGFVRRVQSFLLHVKARIDIIEGKMPILPQNTTDCIMNVIKYRRHKFGREWFALVTCDLYGELTFDLESQNISKKILC